MAGNSEPRHINVIGSGVGGLTAAIILAKMNYSVNLFEKNNQPGGMLRSYTRKGIDCPVGIHYVSSLLPGEPLERLLSYMGIHSEMRWEKMGRDGIIDRYVFDDFQFDLPPGIDLFENRLREVFPEEYRCITDIMLKIRAAAKTIGSLDGMLNSDWTSSLEDMVPSQVYLRSLGCSERLIDVLAVSAFLCGTSIETCPLWMHFLTLASYLLSSWRLTCPGTKMVQTYCDCFENSGGQLFTGETVTGIDLDQGRVKGIFLASGRRVPSDLVIAGLHPKKVMSLLPPNEVKPGLRHRINSLKESPGVFCLHASLPAEKHPEVSYNVYKVGSGSERGRDLKFIQIRWTRDPSRNLLTVISHSPYECWTPWFETVTGRRGSDYRIAKTMEAKRLVSETSAIIGTLDSYEILDTYSPLTLRDWVETPEGGIYGVQRDNDQWLTTTHFSRRAAKGLFMVGQNLMAPGLLGTSLGVLKTIGTIVGRQRLFQELGMTV
jgi:all-trans-retinol 13,14-reductase